MDTLPNLIVFWLFCSAVALPLQSEDQQLQNDVGEYGDHFEGDMILDKVQMDDLFLQGRNGLLSTQYRWPNRIIPYRLSNGFTTKQKHYIELALNDIESVSCLKFVQRTNQKNFIDITAKNDGCYSEVGYKHRVQSLNLKADTIGSGCLKKGTIIHEFLHALGFYHMQSTYDRDDFVKIHYENIKPGQEGNFRKYTNTEVTQFNTNYDYSSVMHYGPYGFSKNNKPTIVPKDSSKLKVIGQRIRMSERDVRKLNAMYKCNAGKKGK